MRNFKKSKEIIIIMFKWFKDENTTYLEYLRADGTFRGLGECIIFPSEEQRDWYKWQCPFVKGDKFDISTLIPYESKVLIRNTIGGYWQPAFWGAYTIDHSDGLQHHDYLTTKGFTHYCIPYDGNEHLLGTTDDCCVFYKTWEE